MSPASLGRLARTCLLASVISQGIPSLAEDLQLLGERRDDAGCRVYEVRSRRQRTPTLIRVLRPEQPRADAGLLYLLPVEAELQQRYGDPMRQAARDSLHVRYGVTIISPTFSELPWYGDHPSDSRLRQEAYFLREVVPWADRMFAPQADGPRRLAGFSKSGWGAYSLLLRRPDLFLRAAAWDAPLMQQRPNQFGMSIVFPSEAHFADYALEPRLRRQAETLRQAERLVLTGFDNFREHHQQMHRLLSSLEIPHVYRDGPQREHAWHGGWLAETVELLMQP